MQKEPGIHSTLFLGPDEIQSESEVGMKCDISHINVPMLMCCIAVCDVLWHIKGFISLKATNRKWRGMLEA